MLTQRYRPVLQAALALAGIWLLAVAGYQFALRFETTVAEVNAYADSVDFAHLTHAEKEKALHRLEVMINDLSVEEQQQVSPKTMFQWHDAMTDRELAQFRAATADSGFKLPNEIDRLPPEQKEKALDARLEKLRAARAQALSADDGAANTGTNATHPAAQPE